MEQRVKAKKHLDELAADKAKGAQIRSRVKWVEEEEGCTRYFLKMEQYSQTSNTIKMQQTESEDTLTCEKSILEHCTEYYKNYTQVKIHHQIPQT